VLHRINNLKNNDNKQLQAIRERWKRTEKKYKKKRNMKETI